MNQQEDASPTAPEPNAEHRDVDPQADGEPVGGKPITISRAEYEELQTLAAERDEYLKRLRRAVADYLNLEKRIGNSRETTEHEALKRVALQIVPFTDSLCRALEAAEQTKGAEPIVQGLRMLQKEFCAILDGLSIRPVEAENELFDPNYHEAVLQQPAEGVRPNTVIKELKKGFLLGEELLRPAQVIVASQPQEKEGE